ncbi:MAG: hypothetical protein VCF24_19165 [Candidatus Latescibacterota bacterium]
MTATDSRTPPIPQWKLERFALGELPARELARLRERLEIDEDLRRRLQTLGVADADILQMYPTPWMARQISARVQGAGRTPAGSWWFKCALGPGAGGSSGSAGDHRRPGPTGRGRGRRSVLGAFPGRGCAHQG